MKKTIKLPLITITLFIIIFSRYQVYSSEIKQNSLEKQVTEAKEDYPEIYNYLNSMTYYSFQEDVSSKKDFYVYVGRPTCGDCNNFEPLLIRLIQDKHLENKLFYLNVAELRKNEGEWQKFKDEYGIKYTPTIAKYVDGEIQSKIEWTPERGISIKDVGEWFSKNE